MAAILPWGLGFSRTGLRPAAMRRANERVLDKPRPQGSHLTMDLRAESILKDAATNACGFYSTIRARTSGSRSRTRTSTAWAARMPMPAA